MYKENPKTKGSGIICAIPQKGTCPNNCEDCFFQSGRSYLEPLQENLPNVPNVKDAEGRIVRINDGNDSNVNKDRVLITAAWYKDCFFNTSIPQLDFPGPVVLTVNPGIMTDQGFDKLRTIPINLMFVRARTNTWNLGLVDEIVEYYSYQKVPVVLTFMAYFGEESIPPLQRNDYVWRKRTLNSYWAITTEAWRRVMKRYEDNIYVYSCGKIEGEKGNTACRFCGNCIREYYAARERMRTNDNL